MSGTTQRCDNCKFWRHRETIPTAPVNRNSASGANNARIGVCLFHAPAPVRHVEDERGRRTHEWPRVYEHDWCGQWRKA